ncbi:hypothetical protein HHK36_001273 [Tetracentron sinense]|uniref:Zinc-ribbon domain-containing protein n=1 Tax=Tetracentron sinense TaxID=13715 RepID=A0A834ZX09_TETSI|nr:hypothetical protein HHK36_001273 [Tetracentron sinense]
MAEVAKVRVVRCPKCENILTELPEYPVNQCGGCGAVLRAKDKVPAIDGSSVKSDEERDSGGSQDLESLSVNLNYASETDREIGGVERGTRREIVFLERVVNLSNTSSGTENKEVNGGRGIRTMGSWYDRRSVEKEVVYGAEIRPSSKAMVDKLDLRNDHDMNMNMNRAELTKINMEFPPKIVGSQRSRQIPDYQAEEGNMMGFRRIPRAVAEGLRFSNSPYPDEGPSIYQPNSSYGYGDPIRNQNNPDGLNTVESLEQDRAVLLRRLDELNDQLRRSCDVSDKQKERIPVDRRMASPDPYGGRDTWLREGSSGLNRASVQSFAPDNHVQISPYFNDNHEHVPMMNRYDMDMQTFYPPSMHALNEIPGYGDRFVPQMLRKAPNQPPHPYSNQQSYDYFSGQYRDLDPNPHAPYPHNTFHQPACSCLHCYNKHWQVPAQVPPAIFYNRRFPDAPTNTMLYSRENHGTLDPQGYYPRGANPPPLHSREPQPHTRRAHNLDSEVGSSGQCLPRRVVPALGNGRRCRPTAGGAPFITCYNCFELLKLPRKLQLMEKNQQKLQCGACNTVFLCVIENKKLVVSFPAQTKQNPLEVDDGSDEVANECLLQPHSYASLGSENSHSDDYDNSGHNFQSTDTVHILSSKDQRLNLTESEKMEGRLSSSSSTSVDEQSLESTIARREVSNSAELPLKINRTRPLPGSPLQEHFDYSSNNYAVSRYEKGNESKRSDQEVVVLNKGTSRQNHVKDASVATEMEVSFNEFSNTTLSQDSGEASKEEEQPRIGKGGGSLVAGFIKRSFRDSSRSIQPVENGISNVSINGQAIPDQLVKKAEKKAGPIHPGQYWYDYQAGFWGVMGEPCLGIIPPFIEEFNYPMPWNCAAGNTDVFINGRELHQKDFDLLVSRGLPTTTDKSYIVEVSGKVRDEVSGEVLDSLGKLAPT